MVFEETRCKFAEVIGVLRHEQSKESLVSPLAYRLAYSIPLYFYKKRTVEEAVVELKRIAECTKNDRTYFEKYVWQVRNECREEFLSEMSHNETL